MAMRILHESTLISCNLSFGAEKGVRGLVCRPLTQLVLPKTAFYVAPKYPSQKVGPFAASRSCLGLGNLYSNC